MIYIDIRNPLIIFTVPIGPAAMSLESNGFWLNFKKQALYRRKTYVEVISLMNVGNVCFLHHCLVKIRLSPS